MDDFVFLTEAQAGALVDRIGIGESGKVPIVVPQTTGATVDIMEGDTVLTREASDRFVLCTDWHEYVPGHGYGRSWEEVATVGRADVVRWLTWAHSPRDLAERIDRHADFDWRAVRWPKQP